MSVFAQGFMQSQIRLISPIMAPGHLMEARYEIMGDQDGALVATIRWLIDGNPFVLDKRIWTPDQLADRYEVFHHQLHGSDPRGGDPRNGPTRLTSFK